MELKEYQQNTLKKLKDYLEQLALHTPKKLKLDELEMDVAYDVFDFSWKGAHGLGTYKPRHNGVGEPIPHICFKVPTGGGKTLLAVHALDVLKTGYVQGQEMFVLWIVPSQTIYQQTLAALRNREHPYRQFLDLSSAGRTLILEKTDRFTPAKLKAQLTIMLLMLPSANRQNKDTLKMFQDASGFEEFFPPEDADLANRELLGRVPNLTSYGDTAPLTSLGNTLRLLQPVILIDEGHKAYSEGALATIGGFNPSLVLELSATPNPASSNILHSVSGQELNREQMIKLDLHIRSIGGADWRDTLLAAADKLDQLQAKAEAYRADGGKYIRPICLIQVERTGKDQDIESARFIHANKVQSELISKLGLSPQAVKIKSSENDGLKNIDLLAPDCPVRYIITKQALQEGWDCPFAYVLVILTNPGSKTAITQLVGRILRQPYARKTPVSELNESYIYCFRRKSSELINEVRKGFDDEGLGDLSHRAFMEDQPTLFESFYRGEFRKFEGKIYLPRFLIEEAGHTRPLNYEMDIQSRVDWEQLDCLDFPMQPGYHPFETYDFRVNAGAKGAQIIDSQLTGGQIEAAATKFDPVFVCMQLTEIVPNPWMAYELVQRALKTLKNNGYNDAQISQSEIQFITEFRNYLIQRRDSLAEAAFRTMTAQGEIRFVLDVEHGYLLPNSIKIQKPQLVRHDNAPIQMSLFDPLGEKDFNGDEKDVAVYLDNQEKFLLWWDRNYARLGYYVQGWHPNKIYPDFLLARRAPTDPGEYSDLIVLETKGNHLAKNTDTKYKESVFTLCNELAKEWEAILPANPNFKHVEFQLVFMDNYETGLSKILQKAT